MFSILLKSFLSALSCLFCEVMTLCYVIITIIFCACQGFIQWGRGGDIDRGEAFPQTP